MTIERTNLSQQVAQAVVDEIKANGLQAGDEIAAEGELAERYGVNRLVVREAIQTLVAREILVSSQGRRARVSIPSPAVFQQMLEFRLGQNSVDLADVVHARHVIETELARRAAESVADGSRTVDDARAALARMTDAVGDRERFITADLDFHQAIADLAGGAVLSFVLSAMNGILTDLRRASYDGHARRRTDHQQTIDAHSRIMDAVAAGSPDAAAESMRTHLTETDEDLGL